MIDASPPSDTIGASREQVLRPSRWRYGRFLLVSLVFVAIGALMIRTGAPMGWFVTAVFGLGAMGFSVLMLPGASYLRLDPHGFTICSFYRRRHIKWSDVAEFGIAAIGHGVTVGFNYIPGYRRRAAARALAVAISGFEAAVPDSYGMTAKDVAALMIRLRDRATA